MLLALLGFSLGAGFVLLGWMLLIRRRELVRERFLSPKSFFTGETKLTHRPACWLAIRAVSPEAVKAALCLNRAQPCSWAEGLSGSREFFISPRLNGWVIVTGLGLPHPGDDVDATFLFLTALSRKLGHVQFFHADRFLSHHAWARLDDGCVTRAFAWAGETLWNQGNPTLPETATDLCFPNYGETMTEIQVKQNLQTLPQLAARWSLDPAEVKLKSVRESIGIAGETAPF